MKVTMPQVFWGATPAYTSHSLTTPIRLSKRNSVWASVIQIYMWGNDIRVQRMSQIHGRARRVLVRARTLRVWMVENMVQEGRLLQRRTLLRGEDN